MKARFQLHPKEYIGVPTTKQSFNHALFSEVAPKYDFITKALSFGRDASWKRRLIDELPDILAPQCIDLACGTGDLTRLLSKRFPKGRIIGLDLTPAMLEIARNHPAGPNMDYQEGTMNQIPVGEATMDVVTGSYALRNAPDLNRAIDEIGRVLRPGGTAAFLDFSKPRSRLGQTTHHLALKLWGGFWGLALHHNPDVYGYIADSLRLFPDRRELRTRFLQRSFSLLSEQRYYGGLLEMLIFKRIKE